MRRQFKITADAKLIESYKTHLNSLGVTCTTDVVNHMKASIGDNSLSAVPRKKYMPPQFNYTVKSECRKAWSLAIEIISDVAEREQDAYDNTPENLQLSDDYEERAELISQLNDLLQAMEDVDYSPKKRNRKPNKSD